MKTPLKRSPYNLWQEKLKKKPWALLAGCIIFEGVTKPELAWTVFKETVLDVYPDFRHLLEDLRTERRETIDFLEMRFGVLGSQKKRAMELVEMTEDFYSMLLAVGWEKFDPSGLSGCGRFAVESFEIFIRGRLIPKPADKELRRYVQWARARGGRSHT